MGNTSTETSIAKNQAVCIIDSRAHLHKHRDINLCLYDWNDVDAILNGFKENGLNNDKKIFIEQRYGPDTTSRRNKALILRKELKAEKRISSGYVAFPAKLMVKKLGDERYTLYKDFSDAEISYI